MEKREKKEKDKKIELNLTMEWQHQMLMWRI